MIQPKLPANTAMDVSEPTEAKPEPDVKVEPSEEVKANTADEIPEEVKAETADEGAEEDKPETAEDEVQAEAALKTEEPEQLTHRKAMAIWREGLAEMIENDPLLMDLHSEVTVEEINAQIALEHGQAMTVNVNRADGDSYPVVVMQNATVHDLKQALKRHVALRQVREAGVTFISWRHVWKKHWLVHDGEKLSEDHKKLKDYGIRNKAEVVFARRLRHK